MKKKYILLFIICFSSCFHSCSDYLSVERYFDDRMTIERIFKSRDYTEQWLANAYYMLLNYNLEIGHARFTLTNFSDDATFNEGSGSLKYDALKAGNYNPDHHNQSWEQSYEGIRQASILINNVDINEELTKEQIDDVKGQGYFIRGYLYWLLLRKYGPVPIMPDQTLDYEDDYEILSLPRSTYDECAEYISEQMLKAAALLKADRDTRSAARPTKGSALAVRAKAYLYAASPLMNGNKEMAHFTDDQKRPLISQTYDEKKWAKAAGAALDVIKLGKYRLYTASRRKVGTDAYPKTIDPPFREGYSNKTWSEGGWADIDPFESYRAMFNGDLYVIENPELIFSRGDNQVDPEYGIISLTRHQMPQSLGGYNSHGITGKQCDAYAMADGTAFNRKTSLKGFVTEEEARDGVYPHLKKAVWKEYANREPRFYASVAFNGSIFPASSSKEAGDRNVQVWYYRGKPEGRAAGTERWQPTGIGMMKYVNPRDSYKEGTAHTKVEPTIRYADILLMYAEALNELATGASYQIKSWGGDEDYNITRSVNEMKKSISQVRVRGGVPNYEQAIYDNQSLLRKALKRERQIELFAENQRYYDLRRWKDAQKEEGEAIYGCNTFITQENAEYFYEQVKVPHLQTSFSMKMYFWPVSYRELQRNKRLTQAPGWQSYD